MIETQNIILEMHVINFRIYKLSVLLNIELYIAQKSEQNYLGTRLAHIIGLLFHFDN